MFERMLLELTDACNLRCVHCFQEHDPSHFMDLDLVHSLVNRADSLGIGEVVLTGGEPTMHPLFPEIYQYVRNSGFLVNVFSNAVSIPKRAFDTLVQYPPHTLSVTLYGFDQGTFRSVTQKSIRYTHPLTTVEKFAHAGVNVVLRFHAMTLTKNSVKDFIDFATSVHSDWGVNVQIIPKLSGDITNLKYRLMPQEIKVIEEEFGLNFTDRSIDRGCELGRNIYISSKGIVQGCPIYEALGKKIQIEKLDDQLNGLLQASSRIRALQESNGGICPAWLHLEGSDHVRTFIQDLESGHVQ